MSICSMKSQNHHYAVIFASSLRPQNDGGAAYDDMAQTMATLAATMPGYLGHVSARDAHGFGITVSYWKSEEAILNWKQQVDHAAARDAGCHQWYTEYSVEVTRIERAYRWKRKQE
ncbi:MAG: antibiotic biosynthesis monooxygenase [Pseudomonadota bacterium]